MTASPVRWSCAALGLFAIVSCAPAVVDPSAVAPVDARAVDTGPPDASSFDVPVVDDPPARLPTCTNALGPGLSRGYGRLDGRLVAIVPLRSRDCNGDPSHLHLQVAANGAVFDVAVNLGGRPVAGTLDLAVASVDIPLPGGPWIEGWHPTIAPLDYVTTLRLRAADFTPLAPAEVAARLESELRDVGRVAVFATGYGPGGAHNVHRNGGLDGALALSPAGASAHLLLFRFATQSF